jgi:hypothetical protein
MNEHTPGPWRLQDNTEHWKTNPWSITVRKPGVNSCTIANLPTRATMGHIEQAANARLIAASPEMFDLLMRFVDWYSNRDASDYHRVMPIENQPPEIQDTMRLLDRITGEQSIIIGGK